MHLQLPVQSWSFTQKDAVVARWHASLSLCSRVNAKVSSPHWEVRKKPTLLAGAGGKRVNILYHSLDPETRQGEDTSKSCTLPDSTCVLAKGKVCVLCLWHYPLGQLSQFWFLLGKKHVRHQDCRYTACTGTHSNTEHCHSSSGTRPCSKHRLLLQSASWFIVNVSTLFWPKKKGDKERPSHSTEGRGKGTGRGSGHILS